QNSIKENRFTNYLKYAFGEIILVAIGILIALQVNNWNNNRLDEIEAVSILTEFKKELINDIWLTNSVITDLKQDILAKEALFKIDTLENIPMDSLRYFINDVNVDVLPNQTVFEKVKTKNITKLTNNVALNTAIFKYFNSMDLQIKSINFFFDAHKRRLNFFTSEQNAVNVYNSVKVHGFKNLSEGEEKNRFIEFISTPRVGNIIKQTYLHENQSAYRLDFLNIEMKTLLIGIQKELKKKTPTIEPLPNYVVTPSSNYHLNPKELEKYVGSYKAMGTYVLDVQIKNNKLNVNGIGMNMSLNLIPISKNLFDVEHSIYRKIKFTESENGVIKEMTMVNINDEYTFIKE
ncbi:MAG: hypothetical protein KDC52_17805, partial [Ignavibacteriae bacterium]|nr:hypothetical protein [Ignavibacteriota bacterium]